MDENTRIKLIKKLDVTDMAGDKVMIDFESGKYFLLRGSASDIWDCIQEEISVGEIKKNLMQIYDIDSQSCVDGIIAFLTQLKDNGFITIS